MARVKKTIQIIKPETAPFETEKIFLSEKYIQSRKIPHQKPIVLRFGAFTKEVNIVPVKNLSTLRISKSLADSAGLHHGATICLNYRDDTRTLSIGPLIGVFISRAFPNNKEHPFGPITSFCKELHKTCQLHGAFVYFFTPGGLGEKIDTVKGWSYTDSWRKTYFPAPDVVYNRLTSRKLENKPSVQHFLSEVKSQYNTSVFNEKYLNKTDVFSALHKTAGLRHYLPKSYAFTNIEILKKMCKKYSVVFLKPITGSLGKGIIRVTNTSSGYDCHFSTVNRTVTRSAPTISRVYYIVRERMKRNRYQIQQGLNLIAVNGRPVDFRALVQRNAIGEWDVTSIVGRIAGNHHFVSNLARGGVLASAVSVLKNSNLAAHHHKPVYQQLHRAAIQLSRGLEKNISGHFGELGIDLGVDTSGKVWLIEINSKPSKDGNASINQKTRPSVRKFVQYARYLAKF